MIRFAIRSPPLLLISGVATGLFNGTYTGGRRGATAAVCALSGFLVGVITWPFLGCLVAVIYVDRRMRRRGWTWSCSGRRGWPRRPTTRHRLRRPATRRPRPDLSGTSARHPAISHRRRRTSHLLPAAAGLPATRTAARATATPCSLTRRRVVVPPRAVPVDIGRDDAAAAAQDELAKPVYAAHRPVAVPAGPRLVTHLLGRVLDAVTSVAPAGSSAWSSSRCACSCWSSPSCVPGRTAASATADHWSSPADEVGRRPPRGRRPRGRRGGLGGGRACSGSGALVRSLEERDVLDPAPGRTADEAAAEAARSLPAVRGQLAWAARQLRRRRVRRPHATRGWTTGFAWSRLDDRAARSPAAVVGGMAPRDGPPT